MLSGSTEEEARRRVEERGKYVSAPLPAADDEGCDGRRSVRRQKRRESPIANAASSLTFLSADCPAQFSL
jgi:hypothetical protein